MRIANYTILLAVTLFVSGCSFAFHSQPMPMQSKFLKPYQSSEKIHLTNAQSTGNVVYKAKEMNLNRITQGIVDQLAQEYRNAGIGLETSANKTIKVSVLGMDAGTTCGFNVNVETGDGKVKKFFEKNYGVPFQRACDFALTKLVATIYNDPDIRTYIDDGRPYVPESEKKSVTTGGGGTAEERLEKLKSLLDKGLISQNQFDKKSDEILSEM